MFDILKNLHIDWRDRRLLQDLYMRQRAVIRIADGESDPGTIDRGVRQGCPISPLLFLIYAEVMMIATHRHHWILDPAMEIRPSTLNRGFLFSLHRLAKPSSQS